MKFSSFSSRATEDVNNFVSNFPSLAETKKRWKNSILSRESGLVYLSIMVNHVLFALALHDLGICGE